MNLLQQTALNSRSKSLKIGEENYRNKEFVRCAFDPIYFFKKYIKIEDKIAQKTVDWQPWPYLVDLLNDFLTNKRIIILKARQLGISWLVVGYCVWKAAFHPNTKILFLSQKEDDAEKLVGGGDTGDTGKAKFILDNLPDWMRPKYGRNNLGVMGFPNLQSSLQALASTINAGRGTDATIVVRDELAHHPYAEQNFAAIWPAVNRGGQLIDLSTADREKVDYHFKNRYIQARRGEIDVKPVFLSRELEKYYLDYHNLDADEWWNTVVKEMIPAKREQEYPLTEDEALSLSESERYFDIDTLNDMELTYARPPVGKDSIDFDTRNGLIKVFLPPSPSHSYLVYTDPSAGKEDPFHSVVTDIVTGEEVCNASGRLPADDVAEIHHSIVNYYNKARNSYEYNGYVGGVFQQALKQLGTLGQQQHRKPDGKIMEGVYGTYITPQHKRLMLGELAHILFRREIIIHDLDTINEFRTMMRIEGEDFPRVPERLHDDKIRAWAGIAWLKKFLPSSNAFKITSSKYKD